MLMNKRSGVNASCPSHPAPLVPLPSPLPDNITNALQAAEKLFSEIIDKYSAPGVVVGIQYMDKLQWTKGFGAKDIVRPDIPPDPDTIFRIASITKVFVVITLYQLFEKGEVKSLDEPLTSYCPEFSIKTPYQMDDIVTLRLVCQMKHLVIIVPFVSTLVHSQHHKFLKDLNLNTEFSHHGQGLHTAYSLLGNCLIEKINSSMMFEDYVKEFILQPLGMTNTGFEYSQDVIFKMATGYLGEGGVVPLINLGWNSPAGQMYSTVNDLFKLAGFLNSMYMSASNPVNKILSPHLIREMGLPMYLNNDGKSLFGTPWEMMFIDTYLVRTKSGNLLGYSSQFNYVPDLGLSIIALINGNKNMAATIESAYKVIIPVFENFEAANMPKVPYPPDPGVYIGNYSCITIPSITANIYNKGDVDFSLTDGTNHYYYTAMLRYYQALELQVYFDSNQLSCLFEEILALNDSWMYFDEANKSGKSHGFYFPWLHCQMNRIS